MDSWCLHLRLLTIFRCTKGTLYKSTMDCQSYAEIPPKRDYGRYFCGLARKEEPPHRGLTELTQIVQTVQKEPLVQEYSVLAGVAQREEKKFSAIALSYGFPRLDIEGVMPYCLVSLKYACEVY